MADQSKDTINLTTGRTAQEEAEHQTEGPSGNPPHPSAVGGAGAAKFVNPSTAPTSKGNYGPPMGDTILK
jgi:hypothetical protein